MVDRVHNRPLSCSKGADAHRRKRTPERFGLEKRVLLEKEIRKRALSFSKESVRIRRVSFNISPVCKNYKTLSGVKFIDQRLFGHNEADG